MKKRLETLLLYLSHSFWFAPMVMSVLAWVAASLLILIDRSGATASLNYFESVESARTVLSVIASSAITVAGTVFSLVMVVLVLASQQYGPLIVSTLSRDRTLQVGMGVFTASFVYALRVLQTLEIGFLSPVATSVAVLVGFVDIGVLILILHRISTTIRYNTIIANIMHELHHTIGQVFPLHHAPTPTLPDDFYTHAAPIRTTDNGYLELVLSEVLVATAIQHDVVLNLRYRAGTFLMTGAIIGYVYPASRYSAALEQAVNEALIVGTFRTPEQDVELMVTQLATMAVRALSPAVNDPYTAMSCIDRLGEALSSVGRRPNPPTAYTDDTGRLRLVTRPATFSSLLYLAFDQIRHYGKADIKVQLHLLKTIRMIGECMHDEQDEHTLHTYAGYIYEAALYSHTLPYEQRDIERAYKQAVRTLAD